MSVASAHSVRDVACARGARAGGERGQDGFADVWPLLRTHNQHACTHTLLMHGARHRQPRGRQTRNHSARRTLTSKPRRLPSDAAKNASSHAAGGGASSRASAHSARAICWLSNSRSRGALASKNAGSQRPDAGGCCGGAGRQQRAAVLAKLSGRGN